VLAPPGAHARTVHAPAVRCEQRIPSPWRSSSQKAAATEARAGDVGPAKELTVAETKPPTAGAEAALAAGASLGGPFDVHEMRRAAAARRIGRVTRHNVARGQSVSRIGGPAGRYDRSGRTDPPLSQAAI